MKKDNPKFYLPFRQFIFRTPCFPMSEEEKILTDNTKYEVFKEALFLASPELYSEWEKYDDLSSKEKQKIEIAIHKYLSRAISRCTPFGLFAGCSTGEFGEKTAIQLPDITESNRFTRLDMNYLCSLIQHLEKQKEIQEQILYFNNDSIYELGGRLRYVEYYFKGTRRVHQISSVEKSEYLQKIFNVAQCGATITTIAQSITDDEIPYDQAESFVYELIDAQLLKSELEVSVTGNDPLDTLIANLNSLQVKNNHFIIESLQRIREKLKFIDCQPIGSTINIYHDIIDEVKKIGIDFEPKFLFQTDLFKKAKKAVISEILTNELYDLITFLNKINPAIQRETNLLRFKDAFYNRFEEAEVPLLQVLDNELGLGYPIQPGNTGDICQLVDDLILPQRDKTVPLRHVLPVEDIIKDKYIQAIRKGATEIVLSDSDFIGLEPNWADMPNTLSVMCGLVDSNHDGLRIYVKSIGGTSAGNLLGRFCHLDDTIHDLTKSITEHEKTMHPDCLVAEIVHLPEARIGNILSRPILREYEIPYLVRSGVPIDQRIHLSDLMLSVRDGRIILRSDRYKKEVIPRLTTAHNYNNNSMPVYHFLCDLQSQNLRVGFGVPWGEWADNLDYKPRVIYKNFILSRQMWYLKQEEIKDLEKCEDSDLQGKSEILFSSRNIPRWFIIPDGDNELLIDARSPSSLRTMLAQVKKRPVFRIEEFLFDPDLKNITEHFTNEFIFTFYHNKNE